MSAVKFLLSEKGGEIWTHSKSLGPIYIIDPCCKVNFEQLYQLMSTDSKSHGWFADDLRFRPLDDENQTGMLNNFL